MSVLFAPTESQLERAAERRARLVRLRVVPKPLLAVVSKIELVAPSTTDVLPAVPNALLGDALAELDKADGIDPWIPGRLSIRDIQNIVCRHFDVTRADLLSARRTANVTWPRQIAMYLARTLTLRSLPEIARSFGGRDHTTALHAYRKISGQIAVDAAIRAEIELLTAQLRRVCNHG